jgi:3-oxoacyl-[acyl-carrier-protein] synthase III
MKASSMNGFSKILGTGSFLPGRVVGNREIGQNLGLDPDYIVRVSGIETRHWVSPGEECSWLAEQAGNQALMQAGLQPEDLDVIILSSTSPEMAFPSTACLLQGRWGVKGIPAFDVSASCTGFLYGLSMADCFIRSGRFRRCLVVAAEVKSRTLDKQDPGTAILFGDGAGAAVLEHSSAPASGIVGIRLYADGQFHELVQIPGGGSRQPLSQEVLRAGSHTLRVQGSKIFRLAVRRLVQAVKAHLAEEKWELDQVDRLVLHQANGRLMAHVAEELGIADDRCFSAIDRLGNTSSASLPIALDWANREGLLHSGNRVLLGAFGGGLTWGTALVRWG